MDWGDRLGRLCRSTLPGMKKLARYIALGAGWLSRKLGRGGGTTLPGVVMLKLRPKAVAELSADLSHGTVLVSATNGKTTTTRLLGAALPAAGYRLVTNAEGSNLERGVATALLKAGDADLGLFEVDEAALGAVARAGRPAVVVLMNLFRDQLDRYGELETLVDLWKGILDDLDAQSEPPALVLNADDPNIAALGQGRKNVVWFGIDDTTHAISALEHAADATTCRLCGTELEHSAVLVGHLGHWTCPTGDAIRPEPMVAASVIELAPAGQTVTVAYPDASGSDITSPAAEISITSPLPGLHNAYNIVASFAASWALAQRTGRAQQPHAVADRIGATAPAFGRGETIAVRDKTVRLLLAKNPTGVNQNVRTVLTEPSQLHVLILLNDRTADGQDISWIWDVDWEPLQPRLASLTLGGDRAWDLALRFRYGGFDMDVVTIEPDPAKALDTALSSVPIDGTLHTLPTYTAMLDVRSVLTKRGHTGEYWSEES